MVKSQLSTLFQELPHITIYIDDIIIIGVSSFTENLQQLSEVFNRLKHKCLQVNLEKSKWVESEVAYLGFLISCDGIKPLPSKIQGIISMITPTNVKQLRSFLGMVNFYKTICPKISSILHPLTAMTGKNSNFVWTDHCNLEFQEIKKFLQKIQFYSFLITHYHFIFIQILQIIKLVEQSLRKDNHLVILVENSTIHKLITLHKRKSYSPL